jgi:hypothetical protein
MLRKQLMLGAFAMVLAAPGIHAQTTAAPQAAAAPQPANAVNPAAVQALKDLGANMATLKRFQVTSNVSGERVLTDGQKLQHTASATLFVTRPDKVRVKMSSARSERELIYDGKLVTLYTPAQKSYSTVAFTGTVGQLIDALQSRFGVEVPLSDLFVWGTPEAPLDKIESAMNAGQDIIDGQLCDHYAYRQGPFDWQIWMTTGSKPLPRKMVITNRMDDARPQSVSVITWNLQPTFKDAAFNFVPPKGVIKAEIVPLKTK